MTVSPTARHGLPARPVGHARPEGLASRRRDCHSADAVSPSLLMNLLKVEGVQQNNSLVNG